MTLAAAPAEPELMVGHAPKLGKKHHHEQNEGYGSFFCTTWIKDGKSFRMINFAIMRGHLIIILTCVFTVYDCAKFTTILYTRNLALLSLSLSSLMLFTYYFKVLSKDYINEKNYQKSNIVYTAVLYYSFGCLLRIPTKYYKHTYYVQVR